MRLQLSNALQTTGCCAPGLHNPSPCKPQRHAQDKCQRIDANWALQTSVLSRPTCVMNEQYFCPWSLYSLIILSGNRLAAAVRCQVCRMHVVENALLRIVDWTHISQRKPANGPGSSALRFEMITGLLGCGSLIPCPLWWVGLVDSRSGCAIATYTKWDYGGSRESDTRKHIAEGGV
ncbi:hypothetical protein BDV24DRAFT_123598 [Aspergillus arachidicola]|uniref:Uncharacterized protein n=1 Tax=Aspergillus arachidicola TaxID=656916 RepID=A0A5N6YNR3_9EURO|nr:hypothetical protein BDV24DRAFT_123598 [Aspergillus arachidicola]